MKVILKYARPFLPLILLSIVMLLGQAFTDLWLPNYMSAIVDVGIQQGGIEEDAPEAMSEQAHALLLRFATDGAALERGYVWQDEVDDGLAGRLPALEQSGAWVRTAAQSELAEPYRRAVYAINAYVQEQASGESVDLKSVGIDGLCALEPAPEALERAQQAALEGDARLQTQIARTMTGLFYEQLGASLPKVQRSYILTVGGQMLLISLLGVVFMILNNFISARVSTGIGRRLRHDVFTRVSSFSPAEFDRYSTASLITRSTNDVQHVQMVTMMGIRMMCFAPIMGVGGIVMALRKSLSMSWIMGIAVVLLMGMQFCVFSIVVPRFKIMQKLLDRLNLVARESLSGMMVIRAFGNEEKEAGRFDDANNDISRTNLFVHRVMALMNPTMNFIMSGMTVFIVWLGGHAVANSSLQIGDMLAFIQYVTQVVMSFLMIAQMFIMIPRALVSAGRIREVLEQRPEILDPEQPETLGGRAKGEIRFCDVSFRYHNAESPVLEHISFTAKPGETTAFIGSTGSGKSTLINLIPRFYDVTEGCIELDGVDIRHLTQKELRDNIGYVPQKGVLFSGDIESNLRFGKELAENEELMESLRVAQAEDFVMAEPEGINSEIAQGGDNVSGGQKQRLSIARALVKDPPVYIFDDSFSALDFKTDRALRAALRQYTGEATVLIVAQRVSTIMHAEQIVVLDQGRIVGIGTHRELLETCEEYREIAESQLSKEELA